MVDDHKYSLRRVVAYRHPAPNYPQRAYGPAGPERTYGLITGVHLVEDGAPAWEYTIKNSFCGEVRRVPEESIFHGANRGYLDLYRRDGIFWSRRPPDSAGARAVGKFWLGALRHFLRTGIPKIRQQEKDEERARQEGPELRLASGDYVKVRGDLRAEASQFHNLYAKVISVSPADIEALDVPAGGRGLAPGRHRVLVSYHVLLDNGAEADIYDVEVKVVYTTDGRTRILNWRAATFLADAFGDDPPYSLQLEYLNGHVFARAELEGLSSEELADLLTRMLYVKGQITWDELTSKQESLSKSPPVYLLDQILATSRFDMARNRELTPEEIGQMRSEDERLRGLFK